MSEDPEPGSRIFLPSFRLAGLGPDRADLIGRVVHPLHQPPHARQRDSEAVSDSVDVSLGTVPCFSAAAETPIKDHLSGPEVAASVAVRMR